MRAPTFALTSLVLWGSGCTEDPSFTVRWKLAASADGLGDAQPPKDRAECSLMGIDQVRVQTYNVTGDRVLVDERDYACFSDGVADGPALPAGVYDLEIFGLRRSGTEWSCVDLPLTDQAISAHANCEPGDAWCDCGEDDACDDHLTCVPRVDHPTCTSGDGEECRYCIPCPARERAQIEVRDDETAAVDNVVLIAPRECDDGIDNDRDGRTDGADSACIRDPFASEADDSTDAVFVIGATFFDASPVVGCFELGIERFDLTIERDGELIVRRNEPCGLRIAPFALFLDAGDYALSLKAVSTYGPLVQRPLERLDLTEALTIDFTVDPAAGSFIEHVFAFEPENFLTPVESATGFFFQFAFQPDDDETTSRGTCEGTAPAGSSNLAVEELKVTVYDRDGNPMAQDALGLAGTAEGDAIRFPCPSAGVLTDTLLWGNYSATIEALSGGETCFATESPEPLAPRTRVTVTLPRVLVDGAPSPACWDCSVDADCKESAPRCVDHVCVAS